jgi:hypothetical protein
VCHHKVYYTDLVLELLSHYLYTPHSSATNVTLIIVLFHSRRSHFCSLGSLFGVGVASWNLKSTSLLQSPQSIWSWGHLTEPQVYLLSAYLRIDTHNTSLLLESITLPCTHKLTFSYSVLSDVDMLALHLVSRRCQSEGNLVTKTTEQLP